MNEHGEVSLLVVPEEPLDFVAAVNTAIDDGDEDIYVTIAGQRFYLEFHEVKL